MLVVPEHFLSSMEHQRNLESSPLTQKLTALDNEMEAILGRKDVPDHEKVQLYNQTLQRYLNYNEKKERPPSICQSNEKLIREYQLRRK